jgi:hypothetical protein
MVRAAFRFAFYISMSVCLGWTAPSAADHPCGYGYDPSTGVTFRTCWCYGRYVASCEVEYHCSEDIERPNEWVCPSNSCDAYPCPPRGCRGLPLVGGNPITAVLLCDP